MLTLEYLNKAGDVIARDYFDNHDELALLVKSLISTYRHDNSSKVYGLNMVEADGTETLLWERWDGT